MKRWKPLCFFLHGITPTRNPEEHNAKSYLPLYNLIKKYDKNNLFPNEYIPLEWGWDFGQKSEDRNLAEVEDLLYSEVDRECDEKHDFSLLFPARALNSSLRKYIFLGFADIFYYVSDDGEKALKEVLFRRLSREIDRVASSDPDCGIYLIFITHSAGTVIAHDFLFSLFAEGSARFLDNTDSAISFYNLIKRTENGADLRVGLFVTMGSPLAPLMVRSSSLMSKIASSGEKLAVLNPEKIGIFPGSDEIPSSRWLNFWDIDDPISSPVRFLYDDPHNLIEDIYPDIGDLFPSVHGKYWTSVKIAEIITNNLFNWNS